MIRVAVIGISGYGHVHYTDLMHYHHAGKIILVGATVINQEEEKEKCLALQQIGCRIFADYREMLTQLDGQIDLCCIPTGILLHHEMTVDALNHHISVLVEKPAAPTTAEVAAMMSAEDKSGGKFAAVGFQYISQPEIQKIKKLLLFKKLGAIKRIHCICLWPRNSQYYSRNRWSGRLTMNGKPVFDAPFSNATAHYLMLALFFAGDSQNAAAVPVSVTGQLLRGNPSLESCDAAELHYHLDNGVLLDYDCAHCCKQELGPLIRIECEDGTATWNLREITIQQNNCEPVVIPQSQDAVAVRYNMWEALFARLGGDTSAPLASLPLANAHVKAVELAFSNLPIVAAEDAEVCRNAEDNTVLYNCSAFTDGALSRWNCAI